MEIYSLEDTIRSFFENNVSPSRKECDALASSLLGGNTIVPFKIQGQFSYTVFCPQAVTNICPTEDRSSQQATDAKIVQFCLNNSKLDIHVTQLAKAIHGNISAETDYYGDIGHEAASLGVYLIQMLPGVTYIELGSFSYQMNQEEASKQLRLIEDFASYFAASWLHPQLVTQDQREKTRDTLSHKLSLLASTLPSRFAAVVSHAQKELGELFHHRYPQVLTHGDLSATNILVSPTTGCVTGIIDWAESGVLPFGLALYGLENLLGYMGPEGWSYFEIRDALEQKFWNQFWGCIADANGPPGESTRRTVLITRQVGVLMQYGFEWENGLVERAVTEKDGGSLAYLDALLLSGGRQSTNEEKGNRIFYAPDSVL